MRVESARVMNLGTSGVLFLSLVLGFLPACNIDVKKDNGKEKNVDIETPLGGIHVSDNANGRDTGLPVYAGSRLKDEEKSDGKKSANVNLSAFGFGLRVVAAEYESDDPPSKIAAYYREQLKKFGGVLECHTSGLNYSRTGSAHGELTCEQNSGANLELKAGTQENQHIVSIKPEGKGSSFALVYVQTHGKDTI